MIEQCNGFTCPVEATISLIGGKYKAVILWHLMNSTLRYSELHRKMPKATDKMLAQQLRELEKDGLINRVVFPVVPPKTEYSLFCRRTGYVQIYPVIENLAEYIGGKCDSRDLEDSLYYLFHNAPFHRISTNLSQPSIFVSEKTAVLKPYAILICRFFQLFLNLRIPLPVKKLQFFHLPKSFRIIYLYLIAAV